MKTHRVIIFVILILFLAGWPGKNEALAHNAPPQRIVSFRPNITEILFALGLGNRVVGVTTFCKYPPEAQKIEKIGGYSNRSLEKILSLKPDLVILVPDATTYKLESALQRSGVDVLVVKADSLKDIEESIRKIAAKAEVSRQGDQLIQQLKSQLDHLTQKNKSQKKALMILQRRPLIVAGSGTFLSEMMERAGLKNIAGTSSLPYPQFSMESVLAQSPEIIIDLDATDPGDYWSRYTSIPAVKNNKVIRLSPDLFIPGPRIPEALEALLRQIGTKS